MVGTIRPLRDACMRAWHSGPRSCVHRYRCRSSRSDERGRETGARCGPVSLCSNEMSCAVRRLRTSSCTSRTSRHIRPQASHAIVRLPLGSFDADAAHHTAMSGEEKRERHGSAPVLLLDELLQLGATFYSPPLAIWLLAGQTMRVATRTGQICLAIPFSCRRRTGCGVFSERRLRSISPLRVDGSGLFWMNSDSIPPRAGGIEGRE